MVIGNTQKGTMERQKQKAAVRDAIEHAVKLWRYKNRLNVCGLIRKYIPDALLMLAGAVEFIPDEKVSPVCKIFIIVVVVLFVIFCFVVREINSRNGDADDAFVNHLACFLAQTEDEQLDEYDRACYGSNNNKSKEKTKKKKKKK